MNAGKATAARSVRGTRFQKLLEHDTRGLDFVLQHQKPTLIVFLITVALSPSCSIRPRIFPAAGYGHHRRRVGCSQDISFSEMLRLQHRLTDVISQDPMSRAGEWPRWLAARQQRVRGDRTEAARPAQVQRPTRSSPDCGQSWRR